MDLLRSCYTTFMRFYTDNPLEIKVRWFWADEEAGIWPGHHLFGSGNWATDKHNWPGPGEVLDAPRVYDPGRPIDGLIGDHFCGPVQSYTEGTKYPGVPLNTFPNGQCACCGPVPPNCEVSRQFLDNHIRMVTELLESNLPTPIWTFENSHWTGFAVSGVADWVIENPAGLINSGPPCMTTIQFRLQCIDNMLQLITGDTLESLPPDFAQADPPLYIWNNVWINNYTCPRANGQMERWKITITNIPP